MKLEDFVIDTDAADEFERRTRRSTCMQIVAADKTLLLIMENVRSRLEKAGIPSTSNRKGHSLSKLLACYGVVTFAINNVRDAILIGPTFAKHKMGSACDDASYVEDVSYLTYTELSNIGALNIRSWDDVNGLNFNNPKLPVATVAERLARIRRQMPSDGIKVKSDGNWTIYKSPKPHDSKLGGWASHCGNINCGPKDQLYYVAEGRKHPKHLVTVVIRDKAVVELKGTSNKKPPAAAHDAILYLLKMCGVTQRLTGYNPSADFHPSDLSEERRKRMALDCPVLLNTWK